MPPPALATAIDRQWHRSMFVGLVVGLELALAALRHLVGPELRTPVGLAMLLLVAIAIVLAAWGAVWCARLPESARLAGPFEDDFSARAALRARDAGFKAALVLLVSMEALVLLTDIARHLPAEFFLESVLGGTLATTSVVFFFIDRSEAGGSLEDEDVA